MINLKLVNQELIKGFIENNYNRYFKCADIVNDVIAHQNGISVRHLLNCRKCHDDPYDKYRRSLTVSIGKVLGKLRDAGVIERYNRRSWRIVK